MNEKSFKPLTEQIKIPKTSYTTQINLQIGLLDNNWAYQLFAGNTLLDTFIDTQTSIDTLPDLKDVALWLSSNFEYQDLGLGKSIKIVETLLKQASDKMKQIKESPPIEETKKAELEEIHIREKGKVKGRKRIIDIEGVEYIHIMNYPVVSLAIETADALRKENYLTLIMSVREDEKNIFELYKSLRKYSYIKPIGTIKYFILERDSFKYCPYCGKKRKSLIHCHKCGKEFPKN